jgi:hypothetical protein
VTSFVPVLWLLGGLALVALFVWASLRYLNDARPHLGWAVAALVALALLAAGAVLPTPEPAPDRDSPYTPLFEAMYAWRTQPAAADTGYRDWVIRQPAGTHPTAHYHPREPLRSSLMDISLRPWGLTGNGIEDATLFRRWLNLPPVVLTPVPLAWGAEWEWAAKAWLHCRCLAGAYGDPAGQDCAATREETTLFTYKSTAKPCPHLNPWDCQPANVTCGGGGGSTDDACPGGLWHECPPPRLPCDEYFPPSASRPYCYTLAGSAQRLRCSDVPACRPGGQPQPEPPEPEPPGGPEPEPPGEMPAACTLIQQLAIEVCGASLSPMPPCATEWACRCEEAP